ncbi:alpha-1,3-galactosidase-related protein [Paenibacillus radicis (ex Gao et al. 2016)]|uniref:Alpha-1,3-galactosidase A n=1 Tax=Paenibacillus radicis (ex Gao et al. 2016) TaxID=1737354 RepID=A0A917H5Q3_9BACL|nr:right-handed parallel beta-helix repeat-containing protein [Paenibacillus radicis (ex Gao et al. 2016)]GGG68425.1 alpha-1,3-galactosidase A [Paenibacillus radicis (ex Gao et al. 2016)]
MSANQNEQAVEADLWFRDFGGRPDSGEDAGPAMRRAIEAAAAMKSAVRLILEPGRYDFYAETADKAIYYITNTASEEENPNPLKTIAIFMKELRNFTLDGNGALFMFHGKVTMFAMDHCEAIVIQNLRTDFARPTVVEMKIEDLGKDFIDVVVHPDSHYFFREGKLTWVGENWQFFEGLMQACDLSTNTTWRMDNVLEQASRIEELSPRRLRFHYEQFPKEPLSKKWRLQIRDGIRDQVGMFIHRSKDVQLMNVSLHFMHGLGIVGQYSENLSFSQLDLSPRMETCRSVAAFADFVHLSGCRGKIEIKNSRFVGSHDDVVNVHGTHLRIVAQPSPNQVVVRFMHAQTYGFEAFYAGDEIEFVRRRSLKPFASSKVIHAEMLNRRELLLTLEHPVPGGVEEGDVLENVTWTPEVEIRDNYFARIPTRGILVTTRRKVVIAGNVFDRLKMSAVLIADDAAYWYESGRVENLMIRENQFIECGGPGLPIIAIAPENEETEQSEPVHENVMILYNIFVLPTQETLVLEAKSTRSLAFKRNTVRAGASLVTIEDAIHLVACSDVSMEENRLENL